MARLLGVDLGEKRVGLAVSDTGGILATPLRVLHVTSPNDAVRQVAAACVEVGAEGVVLGLPRNMDGTEGPKARESRTFAEKLGAAAALSVTLWDERLTTSLVERVLLDSDVSRRRRREVVDKLAAQAILQSYLDAQC
jgi:putative Holliday junction resolvase